MRNHPLSQDHCQSTSQEDVSLPLENVVIRQPKIDSSQHGEIVPTERMGDTYIQSQRLTVAEVESIVDLQKRLKIRFGDAAIRLGLLSEFEVKATLNEQFNYASFSLDEKSSISLTLDILHTPASQSAESIKRLRAEILNKLLGHNCIVIAVISPCDGEGKSHIAASLAISFAQLHINTMLIDADFRSPTQHELFGISNQTGLSTILAKRSPCTLSDIVKCAPNFWVLGSGPPPPNPVEILSDPNLRALIGSFSQDVTAFVIDTPSALQWIDAQIIASQTRTALLVARENVTKLSGLKRCKEEFEASGVKILGVVYNKLANNVPKKIWSMSNLWPRFLSMTLNRFKHNG